MASAEELLHEGRLAFDAGDRLRARSLLTLAFEAHAGPEAAYALARAVEWDGDFNSAIRLYETAFVMYRRQGQVRLPALIASRELSFLYAAVYANTAAADGWLARALSLVAEAGGCVETGWVHLAECLITHDPARMHEHAAAARELGLRLSDPDLELCARSYEGLSLVLGGRITDGMRLVDEAAAGAMAGEVQDYQAEGEIYCKMLLCSELTLDVQRAQQWMEVAEDFHNRSRAAWVPAICGTHYGGILTAAGRWAEAEDRLISAINGYNGSFRALRSAAVARLGDLRLRQGRMEEAAALLRDLPGDIAAVRPRARLSLINGEPDVASGILRRHLAVMTGSVLLAPEMALLAEVELAAGRPNEAATLSRRLQGMASTVGLAQYAALAEYTVGIVAWTAGDAAARPRLEAAVELYGAAALPLEQARARLALARALAPGEPELAVSEVQEAMKEFQRLGAAYDVDAAAQQLRRFGHSSRNVVRLGGPLTARESEVLQLVGEGYSNARIAARLFISKRTVEHHVGCILAALGLESRAEAQAYANGRFNK
ncbi:LuxR C-terminal-related transcriptional regulator [Pseudarthrobacter sulfonivorans]|uniref:helix-turn-helix transcriptional regulator n=1 Tax=Pseudarthrobacter sulfonivorans TaxID=121292 RepID=UPI002866F07F|nr:LuxR C-terminal-related transcriptional regulator [Pseudarthrobacter sulfonivorans]MDR6415788.1 DNA-binding CsgD family transcriptional regulator [Pseudarthrobacter sulfonivorans]